MYLCNCGKSFEKQSSLNSHSRFCKQYVKTTQRTVYLNDGTYQCECGKNFEKSQSLNSHFSRCIIHRKGKPPITQRGGGGWSKGLTKDDHKGIAKMAKTLSIQRIGKTGTSHTPEMKEHLSKKRMEFLEQNPNSNIKWYSVSNGEKEVKVQGKWEKDVAEWLNSHNIKWDRHKVKYDNHRTYTPDFWLPEHNFYIEVKGWLNDRDTEKMKRVISETGIQIKLLSKKEYNKLSSITLNDLVDF